MIGKYGGVIEGVVVSVAVLGFCAYQYWSVTRSIAEDKRSARDARHAEREHELDDR